MIITLFDKVQRAYTKKDWIIDADWPVIANFLITFNKCENKEDIQLFNLWEFDPNGIPGRKRIYEKNQPTENYEDIPGTIRRCKANSKRVYGIVLDYDGKKTIESVVEELSGFEYCLYTTFRHSKEQNKFRVVLPFNTPSSPETFKKKKEALAKTFQAVDHASFSESQSFYLHSGADENQAVAFWVKGEFLDLDLFEDSVEPVYTELPKPEFTGDAATYKQMMVDSLSTCSGLHYASEGTKYGVLTLVALCKSVGLTFNEFDAICYNMADPTSSLKNNSTLRKTAWMDWNTFSGITKKVREEFISAHNGKSKFTTARTIRTAEELKEYVKQKYGTGTK